MDGASPDNWSRASVMTALVERLGIFTRWPGEVGDMYIIDAMYKIDN